MRYDMKETESYLDEPLQPFRISLTVFTYLFDMLSLKTNLVLPVTNFTDSLEACYVFVDVKCI